MPNRNKEGFLMRDIDAIIEDWKYMEQHSDAPETLIQRFDHIASNWKFGDDEAASVQCNDLGSLVYLAATLLKENKQLRKELDSQWS